MDMIVFDYKYKPIFIKVVCNKTYVWCQYTDQIWRNYSRYCSDTIHHRGSCTGVVGGYVEGVNFHTAVVSTHKCHGSNEPEHR